MATVFDLIPIIQVGEDDDESFIGYNKALQLTTDSITEAENIRNQARIEWMRNEIEPKIKEAASKGLSQTTFSVPENFKPEECGQFLSKAGYDVSWKGTKTIEISWRPQTFSLKLCAKLHDNKNELFVDYKNISTIVQCEKGQQFTLKFIEEHFPSTITGKNGAIYVRPSTDYSDFYLAGPGVTPLNSYIFSQNALCIPYLKQSE